MNDPLRDRRELAQEGWRPFESAMAQFRLTLRFKKSISTYRPMLPGVVR